MRHRHVSEAENYDRDYGNLVLLAGNTRTYMRSTKADLKIIHIQAGKSTSLHRHLTAESLFHVLSGVVEFTNSATERHNFTEGTTFIVDPGDFHQLRNLGTHTAVVLEVESPPHDSSDKLISGTEPSSGFVRPLGKFWAPGETVRVKVCGVKSADAAWMCFELGVDAIGIHCVGGSAMVERLRGWASWLQVVPQDLSVFLLTDIDDLVILDRLMSWSNCDTVQLQGAKTAAIVTKVGEFLRPRGIKFVKSIGAAEMSPQEAIAYSCNLRPWLDGIIVDTSFGGGSGKPHDWSVTKQIAKAVSLPIILAGGLSQGNIEDALAVVDAFGVDIETGVEVLLANTPDRRVTAKSQRKTAEFLDAVHRTVRVSR